MSDWTWTIALVVFVAVELAGIIIAVNWIRDRGLPIEPRSDPRYIFRLVRREDRAAYRRIMHRTYAVALRDMSRSLARIQRDIGKALLPSLQVFAEKLGRLLG